MLRRHVAIGILVGACYVALCFALPTVSWVWVRTETGRCACTFASCSTFVIGYSVEQGGIRPFVPSCVPIRSMFELVAIAAAITIVLQVSIGKGVQRERALRTFVVSALVGPSVAALLPLLAVTGMPSTAPLTGKLAFAFNAAIAIFQMALLPAAFAGAFLSVASLLGRKLCWWHAVAAAVIGSAIAGTVTRPFINIDAALPLAAIAGVAGLGIWIVLRRAGLAAAG